MSAHVIDAKAVKRVRAEPHIGPDGRTWLYVVAVCHGADRRMMASGPPYPSGPFAGAAATALAGIGPSAPKAKGVRLNWNVDHSPPWSGIVQSERTLAPSTPQPNSSSHSAVTTFELRPSQ